MQKAENSNFDTNDVMVTTTPIQTDKILKIYELNFYYNNWDKLRR